MPELVKRPRYKIGDKVQSKFGNRSVGRVMYARGTYRPDGDVLYTVYVPMDPEPLIMLFTEEEIDKVDEEGPPPDNGATPTAK
jgi:hypothetical protein